MVHTNGVPVSRQRLPCGKLSSLFFVANSVQSGYLPHACQPREMTRSANFEEGQRVCGLAWEGRLTSNVLIVSPRMRE